MRKQIRNLNEGFTIVEVLIVLAIAALILTIVLIAVPDLQRSARNTDILHDAQNVASAIQSYEGNNAGLIPQPAGGSGPQTVSTTGVVDIGSSGATTQAHIQATDVVYWDTPGANTAGTSGNITWDSAGSGATAGSVGVGGILIMDGEDCGTFTPASSSSSGSTGQSYSVTGNIRAVAVLYPIEGASNSTSSIGCIQE